MPKRFLIADDNQTARRVIAQILTFHEGWSVCAEAADGIAAIEQAVTQRPDILILDVQMPHLTGIEAAQQILELLPDALVILISFHDPKVILPEIKGTKIRGFVSKSMLGQYLIPAAEAILDGGYYFDGLTALVETKRDDVEGIDAEN